MRRAAAPAGAVGSRRAGRGVSAVFLVWCRWGWWSAAPSSTRPTARRRSATSLTFFVQSLLTESFFNSLDGGDWPACSFAALIAVPLAYFTVRFEFRGALLIQTLGVLPLVMPPFVGAVAMQLIFGRSGTMNLLLDDAFGWSARADGRPESA
ncbi:MAG: hypothetical protein QM777_10715 [Pseudorhodoferax sp.]